MEKTNLMTKETRESLYDTSKFTNDFKKVFNKRYKKLVNDFREIVSCDLTSDWGDNKDFTPEEFYMAFKEAVTTEVVWFKKHANRCDKLLSLMNGQRIVDLE
jgi:hypothetical protein